MTASRLHTVAASFTFVFASLALAQGAPQPSMPLVPAGEGAPAAKPKAQQGSDRARKNIYDEHADAKKQIAEALARAKKENRRVLIQWGANWCGWCHKLHELCASDADIKRELLYEYDVVLVDIGEGTQRINTDLIEKYGVDMGKGVPYLTVLDADGKLVVNQDTGSLEEGGDHHDPAKVLAFLKQNQAEPLTAESVLSDGLQRAKEENKLAFVHFGAPWCGWCHRLEDWMARPDVNAILSKDFVDVKIDVDRMVGGPEIFKRYNPKPGGIPWFAFVDPSDGKAREVSEGENGNIGFPAAEQEIARFADMLRATHRRITDSEIQTLVKSLQPPAKPVANPPAEAAPKPAATPGT